MAAEDWLPDCAFEDDEEPDEDEGVNSRHPTCKYCNKPDLRWEMTPAGWRLFEGFNLHECINPFKVVSDLEKRTPDIRHRNHRTQKAGLPHRRKKP